MASIIKPMKKTEGNMSDGWIDYISELPSRLALIIIAYYIILK